MNKKIALVTGGSRGIGAAICEELARAGFFVYINYLELAEIETQFLEKINSLGQGALIPFDIRRPETLEKAKELIQHDRLDILVNNAGILKDDLLSAVQPADWNNILETNFYGAVRAFNTFKPLLLKSGNPCVINMASISGDRPKAGQNAYAVSKAMLIEWALRQAEDPGVAIKYFCISPGPVATDMIKQAAWYNTPGVLKMVPMGRFAEPVEIGEFISLLACEPGLFKSGSNIILDGGFTNTFKEVH